MNKENLKLTLFYTAPKPPAIWAGEKTLDEVTEAEHMASQYKARGQKALNTAKRWLLKSGFDSQQLQTKFLVQKYSKLKEIIQEGETGLYDALVLGRRGLSRLEETFEESVSKGLFDTPVSFPVWVCRKPDMERKGVLVCTDGSASALRVADHVGFILGDEETHGVTLMVVQRKAGASRVDAQETLSKGREALIKAGLSAGRIGERVVVHGNPARAILEEAEKGRHASVAIGRTGLGRGLMKRFFLGSVSYALFRELRGAALWLCH
jgi:nucleotide-binding universal stress UspA family protein